jgi:mannose-6-phosphate isomerase-like protein (cupin superfamily)
MSQPMLRLMTRPRALSLLLGWSVAIAPVRGPRAETAQGPAPAPVAYFVKSAASLADIEKTLEGKGAHGADLLKPGPTAVEIVWRHEEDFEQPEAEVHDGKDHVFFVTDGRATFTLGGELVSPRELSRGEWKAAHTKNAQTVDVQKGDLLFIPHGTVHGRSVKGRRFTMLQISFWPGGAPAPKSQKPDKSETKTDSPPQKAADRSRAPAN